MRTFRAGRRCRRRSFRRRFSRRRVWLSGFVFVLFCIIFFADRQLPLLHEEAAHAALNRFAYERISETVTEHLPEVNALHEGDLVLQDTYGMNQMKSALQKAFQKALTGKTAVWIPLGNLTNIPLLHGRGIKVPLVFSVNGYADAAFITELSDAGINRTKYSIVLEVTAELYSLSVQVPAAVSVRSVYPIYEGVLEGNVPQYRGVIS